MLTSVEMSLDSHLLAFAAEQSRLQGGAVIELRAFEEAERSKCLGSIKPDHVCPVIH